PVELFRSAARLSAWPTAAWYAPEGGNLGWTANGFAWIEEYNFVSHRRRIWLVDADHPSRKADLFGEFNPKGEKGNPGTPLLQSSHYYQTGPRYEPVLIRDGEWVYLTGARASPEGGSTFLDRFNLRTKQTE